MDLFRKRIAAIVLVNIAPKRWDLTDIVEMETLLDICVLAEKPIIRSNILLDAIPIGGFRHT